MKIKFKKTHPEAMIPVRGSVGAAAYDLVAVSKTESNYYTEYDTGIAVAIPEGYVGLLFPRSSISKHYAMQLCNSVGVIDPDYTGPIKLRFRGYAYEPGDRVGQLMVMPNPDLEFEEVEELTSTFRGDGAFGSSGR